MARQLHDVAVDANKNLEELATGLAQAGADEKTIQAVSQMSEVTRKIIKALGKGQETTGDAEPPEDVQQPQTMAQAEQGFQQDLAARRGG
jgi:hypothetical protein